MNRVQKVETHNNNRKVNGETSYKKNITEEENGIILREVMSEKSTTKRTKSVRSYSFTNLQWMNL